MTSYKVKEVALDASERIAEALSGRFKVLEPLGRSDKASSYLAEDLSASREDDSPRLVRLKVLSGAAALEPELLDLFQLEARAASSLSHRNILNTGVAEQVGGYHFCVVEHSPGATTLRSLLDRKGWLDAALASGIALQAARALAEAHKEGVLHLNICPERILIKPDGTVQLAGFGVEAGSDLKWAHDLRSDRSSAVYASPEQASGDPVDHRSDLYSLGVVLFEALTDRVPFNGESAERIRLKHRTQSPLPPDVYCESVPRALSALVMRLLEKRPQDRFESASELALALAEFAPAASTESEPAALPEVITPATAQAAFLEPSDKFDPDFDIEPLGNLLPELALRHDEIAEPEDITAPSTPLPEPDKDESREHRVLANNERIAEKIRAASIIEVTEIKAPEINIPAIETSTAQANEGLQPLIAAPATGKPDAPREAEAAVVNQPLEPAAYDYASVAEPAPTTGRRGRRWLAVAAVVALCVAAIAFANRLPRLMPGGSPDTPAEQPREAGTFVPTPASVAGAASNKTSEAKPADGRNATPRANSGASSSKPAAATRKAAANTSARKAKSRTKRSSVRRRTSRRAGAPVYNPKYN